MSTPPADPRYPAIEDHGIIGDGRAIALIDKHATIDWLTLPEDVERVICASLLDPDTGGRWTLAPTGPYEVERHYLDDAAVLRTTFRTASGTVHVDDVFNLHNGAVLPWVELARRVVADEGTVELDWELRANGRLGGEFGRFDTHAGNVRCRIDGVTIAVQAHGATTCESAEHAARGTISVSPDEPEALLALLVVIDEPLVHPDVDELMARVDRTTQNWRDWSKALELPERWSEPVRTSAFALKLLIQQGSGAPLAAATTSLPERIGGARNYDYRFCWVRDASFTVDALLHVGLVEEAHSALLALLDMARETEPDLVPMYTATGQVPGGSQEVELAGYLGSKPVQVGNKAKGQLQLGSWGHLLDAMWRYVEHGNELDFATRSLLRSLVDHLCSVWTEADAGIWELPSTEQYTSSKMAAWAALDRALRLAEHGELDGDVERWSKERSAIRQFVESSCWSDERNAFLMHPGSDAIDASCLLGGMMRFTSDDQLSGMADAVRNELCDGPWVYRYTGMQQRENAFIACSFWLVDALTRLGRLDEAVEQFEGTLAATNDLGLLSEEHDPATGAALGNFPQGLSHLSLINAATLLSDALDR